MPVVTIGENIAIRRMKYKEKPLIGKVTAIKESSVVIDWLIGSYSGMWKEWRGRSEGKSVIYSDKIPYYFKI